MTLPTAPTVPNPSNMATFESLAYPFAKWIKNAASITKTEVITGVSRKQQTWHSLYSPYGGYAVNSTYINKVSPNTTSYIPIFVSRDIEVTALGIIASQTIPNGQTLKLAIASDSGGFPSKILSQSGAVPNSSAGAMEISIPTVVLFASNIYWVGMATSGPNFFYMYSQENTALKYLPVRFPTYTYYSHGDPLATSLEVTETYANAFTTFTGFTQSIACPYIIQKGTLL